MAHFISIAASFSGRCSEDLWIEDIHRENKNEENNSDVHKQQRTPIWPEIYDGEDIIILRNLKRQSPVALLPNGIIAVLVGNKGKET